MLFDMCCGIAGPVGMEGMARTGLGSNQRSSVYYKISLIDKQQCAHSILLKHLMVPIVIMLMVMMLMAMVVVAAMMMVVEAVVVVVLVVVRMWSALDPFGKVMYNCMSPLILPSAHTHPYTHTQQPTQPLLLPSPPPPTPLHHHDIAHGGSRQ